jgi:hypothetical protein
MLPVDREHGHERSPMPPVDGEHGSRLRDVFLPSTAGESLFDRAHTERRARLTEGAGSVAFAAMRFSGPWAMSVVASLTWLGCGGEYPIGTPPVAGAQPAATASPTPAPTSNGPATPAEPGAAPAATGAAPAVPPSVLGSLFIDEAGPTTEGAAGSADGHPGDTIVVLTKPTPASGAGAGHFIAVCSVPFTIMSSTPAWASSPYDFVATLSLDGVVVGSQRFSTGAGAHDTTMTTSVSCDGAEHAFDRSGQTVLTFRVDGNWTARPPSVAVNPPDRVKVHHVFAQIQYTK